VLIDFVRDNNPGHAIQSFDMRARAPLFDTAPYDLVGRPVDGGAACEVWALTPIGTIAMQARATFA
jgi:3-methylfumaryl-CoA hydratase